MLSSALGPGGYILHQFALKGRAKVRQNWRVSTVLLLFLSALSATGCKSAPDVSGVWKGTIEASAAGGSEKWQGPAELTLNQNGSALSGTLVFTHPQAGRVQVPISSGTVVTGQLRHTAVPK